MTNYPETPLSSDLPDDPIDVYRASLGLGGYYFVVDPATGERRFLEWDDRKNRPADTDRSVFYGPYNSIAEAVDKSNQLGVTEEKKAEDTEKKVANDIGCWLGLIFAVVVFICFILYF